MQCSSLYSFLSLLPHRAYRPVQALGLGLGLGQASTNSIPIVATNTQLLKPAEVLVATNSIPNSEPHPSWARLIMSPKPSEGHSV